MTSERRESEMEAGPEMDALVAERVMGLKHGMPGRKCAPYPEHLMRACDLCYPRGYSRDVGAAFVVVERLRAGVGLPFGLEWDKYAQEWLAGFIEGSERLAPTIPLAICRAALACRDSA